MISGVKRGVALVRIYFEVNFASNLYVMSSLAEEFKTNVVPNIQLPVIDLRKRRPTPGKKSGAKPCSTD